ncbi:SDR family oxidoreductase [Leclercia sp. LTM01]|uniref:SDR family oxidoreductase n=2 Tax=Leclercia TaxID=83654 RepID=A0ABS7RQL5_9ENTR|nr:MULTISPECIES: SDR family oxidoreductase [unclassified Leclercia]MBZ0056639.1 SDR family oxidoreductase [Leclercia sp. EMC7]MCM5694597.1 SDR family oxidoreductase [Leclercia sp. LTM01]
MSLYTVVGGNGFIGSEIVKHLHSLKKDVWIPERNEPNIFSKKLGTLIYCAGSGDCQLKPFEVLTANCLYLSEILQHADFDHLIYVSSSRLYMNGDGSDETSDLIIRHDDNRRLFNLTKLVAEELCFKSGKPFTIVRPSNVYGVALKSSLFLPSITRNAIVNGRVDMFVDKNYEKDYVSVSDVAEIIIKLCNNKEAQGKIINIASGVNISSEQIASMLIHYTNCVVYWNENGASKEIFPVTDITMLKKIAPEYNPRSVLSDLADMIQLFKSELQIKS